MLNYINFRLNMCMLQFFVFPCPNKMVCITSFINKMKIKISVFLSIGLICSYFVGGRVDKGRWGQPDSCHVLIKA